MNKITLRTIPACIAYTAEYDMKDLNGFFNPETDENILYDLQYLMQESNPEVQIPEPDDYNFFEYPFEDNGDGTCHIRYFDMVDRRGKDAEDGFYRFVDVPEILAACMMYQGPFDTIDQGYKMAVELIEKEGYTIVGNARISAEHGPWDRENPEEYVNEIQIPVRK